MAHKSQSGNALKSHEKRRLGIERRLSAALKRLVGERPNHPFLVGRTYRLTVAVLAREARVSRNTIYTNHRGIIEKLDRACCKSDAPKRPARLQKMAAINALAKVLRQQNRELATQNAALLKRVIDAEKAADRLKKHNAKIVRDLAAAREPIVLPRR